MTRTQSVGKRTAGEWQKIECFVAHFTLTRVTVNYSSFYFSSFLLLEDFTRVSPLQEP